jgi:hypothetical protein
MGEGKMNIRKTGLFLVVLFCININGFSEDLFTGRKQLILGWHFANEDTSQQTNIAIKAALRYAEAARYQMESYERYNPSCKIELYREKSLHSLDEDDEGGVFIYINERDNNEYHNRYIEITFYKMYDMYKRLYSRYTLVLYYNNYNWLEKNMRDRFELLEEGEAAFNYFVSEIKKFIR